MEQMGFLSVSGLFTVGHGTELLQLEEEQKDEGLDDSVPSAWCCTRRSQNKFLFCHWISCTRGYSSAGAFVSHLEAKGSWPVKNPHTQGEHVKPLKKTRKVGYYFKCFHTVLIAINFSGFNWNPHTQCHGQCCWLLAKCMIYFDRLYVIIITKK